MAPFEMGSAFSVMSAEKPSVVRLTKAEELAAGTHGVEPLARVVAEEDVGRLNGGELAACQQTSGGCGHLRRLKLTTVLAIWVVCFSFWQKSTTLCKSIVLASLRVILNRERSSSSRPSSGRPTTSSRWVSESDGECGAQARRQRRVKGDRDSQWGQ